MSISHFAKAVGIDPESAAQKAAQLSAERGTQGDVTEPLYCDIAEEYEELRYCTGVQVGDTGFELARQYSTFGDSAKRAAPCAALGPEFGPIGPELAEVIDAWPSLSDDVRANVVAIVRAVVARS